MRWTALDVFYQLPKDGSDQVPPWRSDAKTNIYTGHAKIRTRKNRSRYGSHQI